MYRITQTDIELEKVLTSKRRNIQLQLEENIQKQEGMLAVMIKAIEHSRFNRFHRSENFWNLAAFVTLTSLDLKTINLNLQNSANEWTKRYFVRQACLTIYESLNDLLQLLGKDLTEVLNTNSMSTDLRDKINRSRSELNNFKKAHFDELQRIRNIATAHKDHDSINQLTEIIKLSWTDGISLLTAFDRIINTLGSTIQTAIDEDLRIMKIEHKRP